MPSTAQGVDYLRLVDPARGELLRRGSGMGRRRSHRRPRCIAPFHEIDKSGGWWNFPRNAATAGRPNARRLDRLRFAIDDRMRLAATTVLPSVSRTPRLIYQPWPPPPACDISLRCGGSSVDAHAGVVVLQGSPRRIADAILLAPGIAATRETVGSAARDTP
jgi:hypothetical protein